MCVFQRHPLHTSSPRSVILHKYGMAHRGRFLITQLSDPNAPIDLSFKRESQQSPKAAMEPRTNLKPAANGVNHEQESNKPDTSPRNAGLHASFTQSGMRNGGRGLDTLQVAEAQESLHATPVFAPSLQHRESASPHHASQVSHPEDGSMVPLALVTMLQDSLCGRFTEMMQLHREVMSEMAARDTRRDEQMGLLITQNVELVKTVARMRFEQSHLRESASSLLYRSK